MSPATSRTLTERQRDVMERIDRRVPIKVIAADLGVSETRINQHIRALKDIHEAASLNELVEKYRAELRPDSVSRDTVQQLPFSEAAYIKSQLHESPEFADIHRRADRGELIMNDAMPLLEQAPWLRPGEPKVVPGVLDGEHATLLRFGAIIGVAFGIVAGFVLVVTAAVSISEVLDGRAAISVDEEGLT